VIEMRGRGGGFGRKFGGRNAVQASYGMGLGRGMGFSGRGMRFGRGQTYAVWPAEGRSFGYPSAGYGARAPYIDYGTRVPYDRRPY
jgi:hypothetical protein